MTGGDEQQPYGNNGGFAFPNGINIEDLMRHGFFHQGHGFNQGERQGRRGQGRQGRGSRTSYSFSFGEGSGMRF